MQTYDIGSTGNTEAQNRTALLARLNSLPADDWTINATGTFAAFRWPVNMTSTTRTGLLQSKTTSAPAVFRGICITGNCDDGLFRETGVLNATQATSVRNLTFNWITFRAPRITSVHNAANGDTNYPIPGPDGTGYGVRIDDTFSGFTSLGKGGGAMVGIYARSGSTFTKFRNCTWNGYNVQMDINGVSNWDVRNCLFQEGCIDHVFCGGGTNLTFEYNIWENFRGLNYNDMHNAFGYTAGGNTPPHSDFIQLYGKTTNFIRRFNECYDGTGRCHPLLAKIADGGPGGTIIPPQSAWHVGLVNENNFNLSSHGTGDWINYCIAPVCRSNKQLKWPGAADTPSISLGRTGAIVPSVTAPAVFRDNVSPKLGPAEENAEAVYDWADNVTTGSTTVFPQNWVEFRRGMTGPGVPYAGPGGADASTPTGPAALTYPADFTFNQFVVDPALPATDPRRTAEIQIPSGSAAISSAELRWTLAGVVTAYPLVFVGAGPSSSKIYRMAPSSSGGTEHLRTPGASNGADTFIGVGVIHATAAGGAYSAAATNTFTQQLPYSGDPDAVVVGTFDARLARRITSASGRAYKLVNKEFGVVWKMPG